MAGCLPGALPAIGLMAGSCILSVKRNYPKGERFSIVNFIRQPGKSIRALLARATLPFYLCMIAALLLISFVPQISLWLPELTGSL